MISATWFVFIIPTVLLTQEIDTNRKMIMGTLGSETNGPVVIPPMPSTALRNFIDADYIW